MSRNILEVKHANWFLNCLHQIISSKQLWHFQCSKFSPLLPIPKLYDYNIFVSPKVPLLGICVEALIGGVKHTVARLMWVLFFEGVCVALAGSLSVPLGASFCKGMGLALSSSFFSLTLSHWHIFLAWSFLSGPRAVTD